VSQVRGPDPSDPGAFDPGAYGRNWAQDYDRLYENRQDAAAFAAALVRMAPGGRVLELGVGTGRLAVPMVAAGLEVTGVDSSAEMLELLAARPGGDKVTALLADFRTVDAGGGFDLAVIAFSTLCLLPGQIDQLACLTNVRAQLRPGGRLLVEAFVPDHSRWRNGQNLAVGALDADRVTLKLSVHDPVNQVITIQDVTVGPGGTSLRPNRLRYFWPAELDAMALACGLRPVARWAGWDRTPFTASSAEHVSCYQRPGE